MKRHKVKIRISEKGQLASARVTIRGQDGSFYAPEHTVVRTLTSGNEYFYTNGECEVTLPETPSTLLVSRGIETLTEKLVLQPRRETRIMVELTRWTNLSTDSWYSGDSHVHLHTGGDFEVSISDALAAARAEDLKGQVGLRPAVGRPLGAPPALASEQPAKAQLVTLSVEDSEVVDDEPVEAPVPIDPVENMLELRGRVPVALCANEGLGRTADTMRVIRSRCADVLCFSSYWVGTLRRFHTLCHAAHLEGQSVCKHTHGELGIAAAAGHHVMLSIPNATDGIQQTATMMEHELLVEPTPIAEGPKWGWIEKPGLGVEVDADQLMQYHEVYRRDGQFLPYRFESD